MVDRPHRRGRRGGPRSRRAPRPTARAPMRQARTTMLGAFSAHDHLRGLPQAAQTKPIQRPAVTTTPIQNKQRQRARDPRRDRRRQGEVPRMRAAIGGEVEDRHVDPRQHQQHQLHAERHIVVIARRRGAEEQRAGDRGGDERAPGPRQAFPPTIRARRGCGSTRRAGAGRASRSSRRPASARGREPSRWWGTVSRTR